MLEDAEQLAQRHWQREKFEARDSVVRSPDGTKKTVPGGWDHEHCLLCQAVISARDPARRFGYSDDNDDWLCETCYRTQVAPLRNTKRTNGTV